MAAYTLVFVLLFDPCARGLHVYRRVCAAGAGTRDGTAGSAAAARAGAGAHGRHGSAAARRRRPGGQFPDGVPDAELRDVPAVSGGAPGTLADGWEHIRINEAGLDDAGTSIETKQGDQVLAIDAEYGILLVRVTGEGYRGVLAVCRYPELLRLEMAADPGAEGELAGNIASDHGGILAMNANGFLDPNGEGDGSQLAGWCMSNGEGYGTHFAGEAYQRIELSENGLDCRVVPASDPVGEGTYSAAEFMPALIRDGEKLENQDWTGEQQPRACFGAGDQGICMLVIEGRYPDEGIRGTSVNTCADILLAYGCRNAINMDGGSSAILWYDGEYVTQSSSVTLRYTGGRPLPNAWVYG